LSDYYSNAHTHISSSNFMLQMDSQLDCALDLMRRLPPQQITKNLCDLIDLVLF